jgi:2-polyprenyl-3-methyl-5-hydroxy-6-metoxy-1,4-benzoquinol methylase
VSQWDERAAGRSGDEAVRADAVHGSLMARLAEMGMSLSGAVVCDFGCGTGLLTERLADACRRLDAVDASPAMRDVVGEKVDRNGWWHVRVLDQLPAHPRGYDLIVCSSVLSFLDDHPGTVGRLAELLVPGGLLVHWDWEAQPDDPEGGLTRDEMESALRAAGLDAIRVGIGFEQQVGDRIIRPLMGSGQRPAQ